jgi:hypothetical protein
VSRIQALTSGEESLINILVDIFETLTSLVMIDELEAEFIKCTKKTCRYNSIHFLASQKAIH